ncbi:hypothetical protein R1flu_019802 [Riccia fluitans]|uniref:20 kDa chaperonin, chloroplastic n=1 Tax=Riccia fluitans TaxID=41844 RepID=A0ABD1ZJQ2_9MARC
MATTTAHQLLSAQQAGMATYVGLRAISARTVSFTPAVAFPMRSLRSLSVRAATVVAPKFKTLKPLGDRVLIKIQNVEEKTTGGILLPTTAQTKPQGGEVVEVGEGRTIGDKKIETPVAKGDSIVYSKFAGTEVEFNGEDFLLLKEDDIVGLLKGDDIAELKPLNDRVLIKVSEAEEKTAGGVLLTDSAKEKPVVGEITAAGPGTIGEDGSRKALDLKVGNTVLYSKYAGNDFKEDRTCKCGKSFRYLK